MASIKRNVKKNGEIVYRIQIALFCDPVTGKRANKVITFKPNQKATPKKQENEALRYAMDWENRLKNGETYDGIEMTFAEFADKWKLSIKDDLAFGTYESYIMLLNTKILPYFRMFKVARVKTANVEAFYKTLFGNYANATIRRIANVLSSMFKTAVRWELIDKNPCRDAKVPRNSEEESSLKYFTPQQSIMFLESLDMAFDTIVKGHQRTDDTGKTYNVADYTEARKLPLQLKVFYTLSLCCGFRKSETLALHWDDIDFEKQEICISKSVGESENGEMLKKPKTPTSVRTITFPMYLLPLLKQYKRGYSTYRLNIGSAWEGDGNLFTQWNGKLMCRSAPYQSFKRHLRRYNDWVGANEDEAKKKGLEPLPTIPLHGLRHSCATLLNYKDVNILAISKMLGHAKTSTTMDIYAHTFAEQSTEVAETLNEFLMENNRKHA